LFNLQAANKSGASPVLTYPVRYLREIAERHRRMQWTSRSRLTAFVLILSALTIVLYARTLRQPFVQDDWTVLHEIRTSSVSDYLLHALSPWDKILYRPQPQIGFF
jgi:hypothetical protein